MTTHTETGNWTQTRIYRRDCEPQTQARRVKALSKRVALAKMVAAAAPFACVVTAQRTGRAEYRAELLKQRRAERKRLLAKADRT